MNFFMEERFVDKPEACGQQKGRLYWDAHRYRFIVIKSDKLIELLFISPYFSPFVQQLR